jgi:hypothetical protein
MSFIRPTNAWNKEDVNYLLDVSKIKQVIKNIQECDAISKKWSQIDAEKKQAIFKIHCPVRFQGNYISRTLETDLANFLLKLQGKNQDARSRLSLRNGSKRS